MVQNAPNGNLRKIPKIAPKIRKSYALDRLFRLLRNLLTVIRCHNRYETTKIENCLLIIVIHLKPTSNAVLHRQRSNCFVHDHSHKGLNILIAAHSTVHYVKSTQTANLNVDSESDFYSLSLFWLIKSTCTLHTETDTCDFVVVVVVLHN